MCTHRRHYTTFSHICCRYSNESKFRARKWISQDFDPSKLANMYSTFWEPQRLKLGCFKKLNPSVFYSSLATLYNVLQLNPTSLLRGVHNAFSRSFLEQVIFQNFPVTTQNSSRYHLYSLWQSVLIISPKLRIILQHFFTAFEVLSCRQGLNFDVFFNISDLSVQLSKSRNING